MGIEIGQRRTREAARRAPVEVSRREGPEKERHEPADSVQLCPHADISAPTLAAQGGSVPQAIGATQSRHQLHRRSVPSPAPRRPASAAYSPYPVEAATVPGGGLAKHSEVVTGVASAGSNLSAPQTSQPLPRLEADSATISFAGGSRNPTCLMQDFPAVSYLDLKIEWKR